METLSPYQIFVVTKKVFAFKKVFPTPKNLIYHSFSSNATRNHCRFLQSQQPWKCQTSLVSPAQLLYCNEARMKNRTNRVSKDNSPHGVSTIFSNVSKTGNVSQFICKMARAGTAVKGVSCYRPNIDMFRRRALWSMQRRRARDAQKWFAASQLPRHLWLWLQRALSGRVGALRKNKPGECVQHLHKDVVLCIAKYILHVRCLDDALLSVAKFLTCPVIFFSEKQKIQGKESMFLERIIFVCVDGIVRPEL